MSFGGLSYGLKYGWYFVFYFFCLLYSWEVLFLFDNVNYFFNECIY